MGKKNTGIGQVRQGDLLFEDMGSVSPPILDNSDMVLANGEVTGHKHKVVKKKGSKVVVKQKLSNSRGLVKVVKTGKKPATVKHQSHRSVKLPPRRTIRVTRQRQYTPTGERRASD
jgi:hypothetical protein